MKNKKYYNTFQKSIVKAGRENSIDKITKIVMYGSAVKYCINESLYLNEDNGITLENLNNIKEGFMADAESCNFSLDNLVKRLDSQVYSLDKLVSIISPYCKDYYSHCNDKATKVVDQTLSWYDKVKDEWFEEKKQLLDDGTILAQFSNLADEHRYFQVTPSDDGGFSVKELNRKEFNQAWNSELGNSKDIDVWIDTTTETLEIEFCNKEKLLDINLNDSTWKITDVVYDNDDDNENLEENEMEKTKPIEEEAIEETNKFINEYTLPVYPCEIPNWNINIKEGWKEYCQNNTKDQTAQELLYIYNELNPKDIDDLELNWSFITNEQVNLIRSAYEVMGYDPDKIIINYENDWYFEENKFNFSSNAFKIAMQDNDDAITYNIYDIYCQALYTVCNTNIKNSIKSIKNYICQNYGGK